MVLRTEKLIPFFTSISHDENGKAVIYDGSLDGEEVEVSVVGERNDFIKAELVRVISPSSDRIEPMCPHFGICGGCDLLFMTRERECAEKERIFRSFFGRFSGVSFLDSVFPQREGSRIRAAFRCDAGSKGFFRRGSHEVVDIGYCPLLDPALNDALADLPLRSHVAGTPLSGNGKAEEFMAFKSVEISGYRYHVGNDVFFQANTLSAAALLDFVVGFAGNASEVLDIYAGIGFFSKALESVGRKTIAIEENPNCLAYAKKNLKMTEYHNIRVEDAGFLLRKSRPEFVVIDPPRMGMTPTAFRVISGLKPKRIAYVSCAIDRSIRDIERFVAQGYSVTRAQLYDMAPATRHIETACLLERG